MITYTEDDLRAALRTDAAQTADSGDVWNRLRGRIVRRRRVRLGAALLTAVATVAVAVALKVPSASKPTQRSSLLPTSYQQACAHEPNVCRPGVEGTLPSELGRSLRLPRLSAGETCPVTVGEIGTSPYVAGDQYRDGPVSMIIGDRGDPTKGIVELGNPQQPGWLAAENVWLVDPHYQGPFSVRGSRLDASGSVMFGNTYENLTAAFVEPPPPDPNTHNGYRTPPGSIWVHDPGCYGFQIDGENFSETIVLNMVAPVTATTLTQSS
jgi:hypothetical protein